MKDGVASPLKLFIGVSPDPDTRKILADVLAYLDGIEGARPTLTENLHLTVYFFGSFPLLALPNLEALLSVCARQITPFELLPEGLQWAPPGQSPRMIWVRYRRNSFFKNAFQAFHTAYGPLYPDRQTHLDPIPHITLARLTAGHQAHLPPINDLPPLQVETLTLWRSDPGPEGVQYTALRQWKTGRP